ncbi:phage tail spike protein, partial [Cytobacillus firmus]
MSIIHILDGQTDVILATSSKFYNDVHRETLKNEEIFDFIEPITSKASPYLNKRNRVIIPTDDGFFKEFIIEKAYQSKGGIEVYSSASYFELMKAKPIAPMTLSSYSVEMLLDFILNDSDWIPGIKVYDGIKTIVFDEYTDPYSALKKVADEFGLELRFRIETNKNRITGRYVDLLERVGEWRGKEITSGKDLLNAKRIEFTQNIVTALVGVGPQKENGKRDVVTVANESARQAWGRNGQHLWGIYQVPDDGGNEDMTIQRITQLTSDELQKRISTVISWEVESADIEHIFGREHEKVRLGDQVRVKLTDFNPQFFLDARIISREGSIRTKAQKKYVLGEFIEYTAEDIKSVKRMLQKQIEKKLSETQVLEITYPKGDIDEKLKDVPITDDNFPDETPPTPENFEGSGLFKIIQLKWDYSPSSLIASYEVYA